jgi:hypothetical protein
MTITIAAIAANRNVAIPRNMVAILRGYPRYPAKFSNYGKYLRSMDIVSSDAISTEPNPMTIIGAKGSLA